MFKLLQKLPNKQFLTRLNKGRLPHLRTFLSQAYYCDEVWNQRLSSPLLQKVNVDDLYFELDQRYQKTKQLNALDIDILVNSIQTDALCDELLDIVYKLRLTADTCNTTESTSYAMVRILLQYGKAEDLLNALDDRLNYGLFLDYYTANLLMDTFWKSKEYANGARVISQLMLQEELEHPLTCNLGLLHCYKYLLNPLGWPEYTPPTEPEDEVKIRVRYLRNPYDDEHFDLRDPNKIVGKTLVAISKGKDDPLHQSLCILGLTLFGKNEEAEKMCTKVSGPLYKEILDLVPEDSKIKERASQMKNESVNVEALLIENIQKSFQKTSEKDISEQCKKFEQWEKDRIKLMEEQKQRLSTAKKLQNIEDLKKALKEKEERLWFFENEEQIDLAIEAKKVFYPKRWFGHKKKPKQIDEGYVPPEITNKQKVADSK